MFSLTFFYGCKVYESGSTSDKTVNALSEHKLLCEVLRYLYLWYLDESDIEAAVKVSKMEFQIRSLPIKLDQGDNSQFGEIFIPTWQISLTLKKSDYKIEECDKEIKSNGFKIVRVSRVKEENRQSLKPLSLSKDVEEIKEYLTKTRKQAAEFSGGKFIEKARKVFRDEIIQLAKAKGLKLGDEENVINVAPLSVVGNELWIFWERGKFLIKFSCDTDISNPTIWDEEKVAFHVYDTYNQVVVSLEQAAGSNEFMTRSQIGRILYNCIVLGKRMKLTLPPSGP